MVTCSHRILSWRLILHQNPLSTNFPSHRHKQGPTPLRDILSHSSGLVRIRISAEAMSLALVGSTSRPWCSVDRMSTGPPFLVATVGTPCAAACGEGKTVLGQQLGGCSEDATWLHIYLAPFQTYTQHLMSTCGSQVCLGFVSSVI